MTSLQSRALGKGLTASVQRSKERIITNVSIEHEAKWQDHQLLSELKHVLLTYSRLNAATTTIRIDHDVAELKAALAKSQAALKKSRAAEQELRQQLAAVTMTQNVPPLSEWVPVLRAAEIIGVSKQTLYRAIEDQRISFQGDRGRRRSSLRVDPSTYRPKPRPLAQPRKRKSKK